MGFIQTVRNFLYAATHANQLIREIENSRDIIKLQKSELERLNSVTDKLHREKSHWETMYKRTYPEQQTINRPAQMNEQQPVGQIEYLGPGGDVVECVAYTDATEFVKQIMDDNNYGVPMYIAVFSDPVNGSHIDTSWRRYLDPLFQGFRIVPYQAQAEPEIEPDNFCSNEAEVHELELEV